MLFTVVSSIPLLVCLFWIGVLLQDTFKNAPKRILIAFMGVCAVNYFVHLVYFNHYCNIYVILDSLWVLTTLSVYPLCYYYIRVVTADTQFYFKWLLLLLPAVILSVTSVLLYMLMSAQETEVFIQEVMYNKTGIQSSHTALITLQKWRFRIQKIVFGGQVIFALYFGYKLIKDYADKLKAFYSTTGDKNIQQVKNLLYVLIGFALLSLVSNIIGKEVLVYSRLVLSVFIIVTAFMLFTVGYIGSQMSFTVREFMAEVEAAEKARKMARKCPDEECGKDNKELINKLIALLEIEQLFKKPELRISDIAEKLCTNRTYISRAVNEELHTNFCDLINTYRVEYAKELLTSSDTSKLQLSEIASMSGFLSESSFYRAFKRYEQISPRNFCKNEETYNDYSSTELTIEELEN